MAKEPDEPSRPRGRPRVDDPMSPVSTRLPSKAYDQLIRVATQQDTSVASLVRQLLILRLPKTR